jgi:hypothetical protein
MIELLGLNDLSMAEKFLACWSVVASLCAIYYQARYKSARTRARDISFMLCEVVVGELKARKKGDLYTLETDEMKFEFKRRENG